jgi:hypothetical protein
MADQYIVCAQCSQSHHPGDPFCPYCGEQLPGLVDQGEFQVVVSEVASQRLRDLLVENLRLWFPSIDPLRAETALKSGAVVIVDGIDHESAQRLVNTLHSMKIAARVDRRAQTWTKNLWNAGLLLSVPAVLALVLGDVLTKLVAIVVGVGAPMIGAVLKSARLSPLVDSSRLPPTRGGDERLATRYKRVMEQLEEPEARLLARVAEAAFDMRRRLRQTTLPSTAAGQEGGELYEKLDASIWTSLKVASQIPSANEEDRERQASQLEELVGVVTSTRDWYISLEDEHASEPDTLTNDLRHITGSIDRILEDARPQSSRSAAVPRSREEAESS